MIDIPRTLIRQLANLQAISLNHGDVIVRLSIPLYDSPPIAKEIADLYCDALLKIAPRHNGKKCGLIGASGVITPILGILGQELDCPVVTIGPDPADHAHLITYGTPKPNHWYVFIDDVLKTGATIAQALEFWVINEGFAVTEVLVFCDLEMGGPAHIQSKAKLLSQERGIQFDINITSLSTRAFMTNVLLGLPHSEKIARPA